MEKKSKNFAVFGMVKERHRKSFETALKGGKMDEQMISLCKFAASTKNFFTSSGCAGRIILLEMPDGGKKCETNFHRKWHRPVKFEELWKGIEEKTSSHNVWEPTPKGVGLLNHTVNSTEKQKPSLKSKGFNKPNVMSELWFKLDPFILHIGTDSLKNANKILRAMAEAGVKRGGIIVAKQGKFIIEMQGTETTSFPVKIGNDIIVEKKFLEKVLEKSNKKLEKNYENLKRLEKSLKTML